MSVQLVIAEKPSVARSIATVIGADEKQNGYWQGGGYLVSWCMQKRSTVYGSSGSAFTTTAWAPSRFQAHFLCRHLMCR